MKTLGSPALLHYLLAFALSTPFFLQEAVGESPKIATGVDSFYKTPSLFSTRPKSVSKFTQSINRFGPVGIGIELTQPAFGMKIKNVEPGSPAAVSKKLKKGQLIDSINGQVLKDIDPRIQLGNIVTRAEATDGKITFVVRNNAKAKSETVTVEIPVLGAYGKSWPLDCPKSDRIVKELASKLKREGHSGQIGLDGPKILFMLSTGEKEDLDVVRGWMKALVEKNRTFGNGPVYQWNVSWGAPAIAEYHLRTGDESVLPLMKRIADGVQKNQYQGGWGGRGMAGHHMGLAGTGTLTFLLLAKQCGVDVDDDMLQSALAHYYRFAGRGTNPYMDAFPENTFTDNGRNGRLAFAMNAASQLSPDGENSLYAKARNISSMKSFYSTSYMLHGHTGGGIGEVWRSASMGLMAQTRPNHYREFMEKRSWFYDLSRRHDGSFGIIGGGDRYDNTSWGLTLGLTYTAPRKKLAIFGAPKSKFSKVSDALPKRCWGNAADDSFLSIEPPPTPDGKIKSLDGETIAKNTGLPVDRLTAMSTISDQEILDLIYHPEHRFREKAAEAIKKQKRYHLILPLLRDADPRVRNAGVMACEASLFSSAENDDKSAVQAIKARLLEMLVDPDEAWFTSQKLLNLASGFHSRDLLPHIDVLTKQLAHGEWWVRHKALEALLPLALDPNTYQKVLPSIEEHFPNFIRVNWQLYKRLKHVGEADPKVQSALLETLGKVYLAYPGPKAIDPPGGKHPATEEWIINSLAYTMELIPGGLEKLFEVSTKRYPNNKLNHRNQFLSGTEMKIENPDLKKALRRIIYEELIPQHIGKNWKALRAFAESKTTKGESMSGLLKLHSQSGVMDYNWKPYFKQRHEMSWDYHSFDPPEIWEGVSDRLGRYRNVTFPPGMESWFKTEFKPSAHGWKTGLAPFGANNGKKGYLSRTTKLCPITFCRCGEPINTLWEKDVILIRGTFEVPPFEEGYVYRLLHGGISHVGVGGGFRVYINGKLFYEDKTGVDRRGGNRPEGQVITKKWWPEFSKGSVTLAAISFKKHHPRTKAYGGNFDIFLERMKVPPPQS